MAEEFRTDLPRLAEVLTECYGVKVEAILNAHAGNEWQTVSMSGTGAVPSCLPPEVLHRKHADHIDEYGTIWCYGTLADGSWYVHRHVMSSDSGFETPPPGARRRWPLKWCETEVARILKRAAGSHAQR